MELPLQQVIKLVKGQFVLSDRPDRALAESRIDGCPVLFTISSSENRRLVVGLLTL